MARSSGPVQSGWREAERWSTPWRLVDWFTVTLGLTHGALALARAELDRRIEARVEQLVAAGLVDEVRGLLDRGLRDGTTGRRLAAVRARELAGQSIGISATRSGVTAFAISGFVAGLGGGLLSIQQQNVNYATNFSPYAALFWVVVVVSLGVRTVKDTSHAAAGFALTDPLLFSEVLLA